MAEILLVEDEQGIREGLAALLRMRGHLVRTAESATTARGLLACAPPDLLVTDLRLPDGDGAEVLLEARRALGPALPVLVMTGHASPRRREELGALPGVEVLTKPVRPCDVLALAERMLAADAASGAVAGSPAPAAGPEEEAARAAREAGASHDACDRAALVAYAASLCGAGAAIGVRDEGELLRLEIRWPRDAAVDLAPARWILDLVGGDAWGRGDTLRVALRKDGRPRNGQATDLSALRPRTREELVEAARRTAAPCNLPPWLRLLAELAGEGRLLVPRDRDGCGLPPEQALLWG